LIDYAIGLIFVIVCLLLIQFSFRLFIKYSLASDEFRVVSFNVFVFHKIKFKDIKDVKYYKAKDMRILRKNKYFFIVQWSNRMFGDFIIVEKK